MEPPRAATIRLLSLFNIAIRLGGDALAYYWRGGVRLDLGDITEGQEKVEYYLKAISDFDKSIELSKGKQIDSYNLRGIAKVKLADEAPVGYDLQTLFREAIDDLRIYLVKENKDSQAHDWLAEAYVTLIEFLPPSEERDELRNRALFHKQKAYEGSKKKYLIKQIEDIKDID